MISTLEKVLFLKSIDLFSQIPGEDLARVAHIAEEVDFETGDIVMREGEIGDSMYLLVDGEVAVRRQDQEIATLHGGECVGEMAILDSEPRSATVVASDAVRALRIEREDFYELMSEKMEIAQGVIQVLTRRLRATNARTPPANAPVRLQRPERSERAERLEAHESPGSAERPESS